MMKELHTTEELKKFNCMGYAFGVVLWMNPRGAEFLSEWIEDECGGEVSDFAIACSLDNIVDNMLEDYPGLEIVSDISIVPLEKEVMAFRIIINPDDVKKHDFHFKVRRNGGWTEKDGDKGSHECDLIPNKPWNISDFQNGIWSDIVYLAWNERLSRDEIEKAIALNIDGHSVVDLNK